MWDRIDSLLERAPEASLRLHRVGRSARRASARLACRLLAPVWGLPAPHATTGALASLAADGRPLPGEAASTKLRRTALALREAGRPRSVHDLALEERGGGPTG